MREDDETPGLVRVLQILRERWWVVLAAALVCTAAALAMALTAQRQYEASASLLFRDSNVAAQVTGTGTPPTLDPDAERATNELLVTTGDFAAAVREQLRTDRSVESLQESVEVGTESGANIASVTFTDPDPRFAAAAANAFAEQYVESRKRSARAQVREGIELVRGQLAELPEEAEGERTELRAALQRLVVAEAVQTGDAEVVDRAAVPADPSSPRPARDAALALLLGLVLGVGIAFLLEVLDRRMKSVDDLEETLGVRALVALPERTRAPSSQSERSRALEPFRILRNGIGLMAGERPVRVVVVTSAVQGEGKSTIAGGLARATALAGQRVVLVEADLRRPTFHRDYDLGDDRRGLTTALVGGVPVAELCRTVLPGLRDLSVLPAGPLPPNSAELLRSPEMSRVLADLGASADVVVLDAPPLLPVADARALLDQPGVDACLLVARAFRSTREDVRRARAVLDRHWSGPLGLVVNGVRESEHTYGYESEEADQTPGSARQANRVGARS